MLAQLECENTQWTPDRQELGGTNHYGLWQASSKWFPQAADPAWRQDPIRQVNEFIDLWLAREDLYNGDIDRILEHHFGPVNARNNTITWYTENIKENCLIRFI
jgi:hypothetical protein